MTMNEFERGVIRELSGMRRILEKMFPEDASPEEIKRLSEQWGQPTHQHTEHCDNLPSAIAYISDTGPTDKSFFESAILDLPPAIRE